MISFWSGSGNENYFNTPQQQQQKLTKNNIEALENSIENNLTREALMERYLSVLESVEVYKLATNVLMKENQELKLQLKLVKNEIEIDENQPTDYTD